MAPLNKGLLALAATSISLASANTVSFNIAHNPQVQAAQLRRRQIERSTDTLMKRADTVTATLLNYETQGLYAANVTVGTPGQKLALQIDTGSSDVWVPSNTAALCSDAEEGGCPNGEFDSSKSSTFKIVEQNEFNISYVDGTGSIGSYFEDTFEIGGTTLKNFQMGIATTTSIGTGIMGIGYNTSEANTETGNGTIYPNLPSALLSAGAINTRAYSLWLDDLQATSGSVLFGGIDTDKYTGDLISVDVYPDEEGGTIDSFTVAWTKLTATSSSGSDVLTPDGYAEAAILDSGTTITLLPDDIAELVFEELGATVSQELGAVVVPCSLADNTGTLDYQFGETGGPIIKVQMSQIVLPLETSDGSTPTYSNGEAACQLGIEAAGDLPVLFGDTFLRSAYAVYDIENNMIALAQTDFNSTSSNVVAFASLGAAIPSATAAVNQAEVTQTASGVSGQATGELGGTGSSTAGLSAASGFGTDSTATADAKKSAGELLQPFAWSRVTVMGLSLALAGVGGGFFALL